MLMDKYSELLKEIIKRKNKYLYDCEIVKINKVQRMTDKEFSQLTT